MTHDVTHGTPRVLGELGPRNKTEPVVSWKAEPLGPLVVGDGSRRARAAQLGTRVGARSEGLARSSGLTRLERGAAWRVIRSRCAGARERDHRRRVHVD